MKTKELIKALQKLDPEKEVMIQQGGEHDYMTVYGAKEMEVWDENETNEDEEIKNIVGIQFT